MACINKLAFSKTLVEEYRANWKIANFSEIRGSNEALEAETYRFEMGSSINLHSKWKCYLTLEFNNGRNWINANVALDKKPRGNVSQLFITLTTEVNREAEVVFHGGTTQTFDMLKESCLTHRGLLPQDEGDPDFDNFVNADGSLCLNLTVNLFNLEKRPTSQVCIPLTTLQSQFQFKQGDVLQQDLGKICKNPDAFSQSMGICKVVSNDDKEFFVNPEILTVRCPVLYLMLAEKETPIVRFSDISGQHLETVLGFVHTATLPQNWEQVGNIDELVYTAERFELKELATFLEQIVQSNT